MPESTYVKMVIERDRRIHELENPWISVLDRYPVKQITVDVMHLENGRMTDYKWEPYSDVDHECLWRSANEYNSFASWIYELDIDDVTHWMIPISIKQPPMIPKPLKKPQNPINNCGLTPIAGVT